MKIQVVFGRVDPDKVRRQCHTCRGSGRAVPPMPVGQDWFVWEILHEDEECWRCHGSGQWIDGYTYLTSESVEVGAIVEVPGNWYKSTPQEATVVDLSSDYDGECSWIKRVVEPA